jgi:hypothetical protein
MAIKSRTKFFFLSLAVLFVMNSLVIFGQDETKQGKDAPVNPAEAKFENVRNRLRKPLPFKAGEQLDYELRLSRFPIYGIIGSLTFTVDEEREPSPVKTEEATEKRAEKESAGQWKIFVEARSKGLLTSLFRVHIDDVFTSYIDKNDFGVIKTDKKMEEGKRRRQMVADFDRTKRMVKWVHTDLNNSNKALQILEKPTLGWVTDIVSGWYVLRAQELKVGESLSFPLSDNGETYEIQVDTLGREKVETELGKFDTLKLDMKIFDGKFIKRKGKLFVWVTDDEHHLPVRGQIKASFGTVTVTLIDKKS